VKHDSKTLAQNIVGQFTENLKNLYKTIFIQKFKQEEIDVNDLEEIDIEVLKSWGIKKKFHQNKIIRILDSINEVINPQLFV
jgi:hypothetical protein